MKITTKEVTNIVEAYNRLGFIFYEDEEKLTRKKTKKKTYVLSYINDNQECISVNLEDIMPTDLHSAYMHSNKMAESKNDLLINNDAFLLLFNKLTTLPAEDKDKLNKRILKFLEKNPEYVEEKDYIKSAYYAIPTDQSSNVEVNEELDNFVLNTDIDVEKKKKEKAEDEIDTEKIKMLIEAAMEEYDRKAKEEEEKERLAEEKAERETAEKEEESTEEVVEEENTDFVLVDSEEENTDFVLVNNEERNEIINRSYYVVPRNRIIQDELVVVNKKDNVIDGEYKNIESTSIIKNNNSTEIREANINKNVKVVNVEEHKVVADKARKETSHDSVLITAGIIILSGALLFAGYNIFKNRDRLSNKTTNTTEITNDIDINDYNTVDEVKEENNQNDTQEVVEPSNNNTNEEVTNEEETNQTVEEVTEEVNVHSDDYIIGVTNKIYDKIRMIKNANILAKYDANLIEALVRYTHHNYSEYTGNNILSNEIAYEDMSELIRYGFDISMFYEGLNNYENLNALYNATMNIKQEKGNYEDEFKVYMCMDVIMDDMNTNNFPEAIALRAYVDNYSVVPSMQMAREQAGVLEMKDTQDLWKDVNKDGSITYEENAEGKGYNDEKAAAIAAKYNEMSSEKCRNIYNRISTDDHNSELTTIVYRAIDEDEARVRTR